ncbi:hypothetical protein HHI36_011897 [Cryptolaemus montrouzieri]|uniref:Uncharacterized protein n=1 Tax=Cryptolaemus montrouzieri TaxID=559131 RepID=A0ABD2NDE8_9CUCU
MVFKLTYPCSEICRICLENKMIHKNLMNKIQVEAEISICIIDLLEIITSDHLKKDENYPSSICIECLELAKSSYLFKIKYEKSLQFLCNFERREIEQEELNINSDQDTELETLKDHGESVMNDKQIEILEILETNKRREIEIETQVENKNLDSNVKYHPCPICLKKFSALELKKHAAKHKALRRYFSISNNIKMSSSTRFYSCPSVFSKKDRLHKCLYCDQKLLSDQFLAHLKQHKVKTFKCEECNRVFRKINHLNGHRVKAHIKEFPFKCEHCKKGFMIKKNYECHLLLHSKEELPHQCSHCLKRFSNPVHLRRHLLKHTEVGNYSSKYKVLKCHQCLKIFENFEEMNLHTCDHEKLNLVIKTSNSMKQVSNEAKCDICHKVYNSKRLYFHIRYAHGPDTKKLCSVCGVSVRNIKNHMLRHKGDKPHVCSVCEKRFSVRQQLSRHMDIHTGVKKFICSVCGKAFNNLYNLHVHERIHIGQRNHICVICDKAFLEKSYLRKHMNVHRK